QPFADVLAGEVWILLLEDACLARVAVEDVGERRAKAGEVAATLDGVDRVGESEHVLDERVVVLQRDLDLRALDLAIDIKGIRVDDRLVAVEGPHERNDSALEVERVREAELLIGERD